MAIPGMEDYPIKLGTLLFTMVEPEKGHEVEYNRWYEHDHFYSGCMVGAVAVRRRPLRRHPAPEGPALPRRDRHDPRPAHRVVPRDLLGARGQARRVEPVGGRTGQLAARERPHVRQRARTSTRCSTRSVGRTARDDDGCTIELALDHNYPGLVVVAGDVKDGHTHDEVDAWFRDTYLPDASAQPWGPDLVLDATTLPLLDDRPADVPAARGRAQPVPAAPLPRPRSRGGLGRRLRQDRPGHRGQRPRQPRVDGAVHPDRLRHRQVHRRALVVTLTER